MQTYAVGFLLNGEDVMLQFRLILYICLFLQEFRLVWFKVIKIIVERKWWNGFSGPVVHAVSCLTRGVRERDSKEPRTRTGGVIVDGETFLDLQENIPSWCRAKWTYRVSVRGLRGRKEIIRYSCDREPNGVPPKFDERALTWSDCESGRDGEAVEVTSAS